METIMYMVGYDQSFKAMTMGGWGCGYVGIPANHPYFSQMRESYHQPEGCSQEITYDEIREIAGKTYRVIGFDTVHIYNNASHDHDYVLAETLKLKAIIDSYQEGHDQTGRQETGREDFKGYWYIDKEGNDAHTWDYETSIGE